MLNIASHITADVMRATRVEDLHKHLQAAIKLEHATIPPYLTALYSIKSGRNVDAYDIIQSVVREEMLHMMIAANIMNAIGGSPEINSAEFIPTYPGPLPMGIDGGLQVGLDPLSIKLVEQVFMHIEEPEHIARDGEHPRPTDEFTIGMFYRSIIEKLKEFGPSCIVGDLSLQVVSPGWFPADELFAIDSLDAAERAINIIIEQGEGTTSNPDDPDGEYAHYYRFAEIAFGRRLVPSRNGGDLLKGIQSGQLFSGPPVHFDPDGVYDIVSDSKSSMYRAGSPQRRLVDQFNVCYSRLLNALHDTFNGNPSAFPSAIGVMYELKLQARAMVEVYDPVLDKNVAPAFEYVKVS